MLPTIITLTPKYVPFLLKFLESDLGFGLYNGGYVITEYRL